MTPIQQLMLGVGASKKTYIDDIFSTYLWAGNSTENRNINNGINLSGEGGMTWIKKRNASDDHLIYDTVRGHNERLIANSNTDNAGLGQRLTGFNTNGFKLGNNTQVNASSNTYASYSFRKTKGFFDVVKYTGNGTARTISHSLGCVPGLIIIKKINATSAWRVYHRSKGASYSLELNHNTGGYTADIWNNTLPTASEFSLKTDTDVNSSGQEYMAYLFAGGESTAATARSIDFDGVGDALVSNTSTDYVIGTNNFTLEFWIRFKDNFNGKQTVLDFNKSSNAPTTPFEIYGQSQQINFGTTSSVLNYKVVSKQWNHVAFVRSSGTTTLYFNGTSVDTFSDSNNYDSNQLTIGGAGSNTATNNASCFVSNVRLVVGTAVYTSSFRPPTEPLTNITNTKFLACQNSTTTGTTVGSIQAADGNPTASSDSPFDDPGGFKFGDSKEGIVKCGSYVGNAQTGANGPKIFLGFEPQWVMVKNVSTTNSWMLVDSMRGILNSNSDNAEYFQVNDDRDELFGGVLSLTSTGFQITHNSGQTNTNGHMYIYVAIRRPDGYVGKPAEAGTDVFAIDTGSGSATIPTYDSGFPVDFSFQRTPDSNLGWWTYARLLQGKYMSTNSSDGEATDGGGSFDSNVGYSEGSGRNSSYQAWMWKRHAGLDVVTTGPGTGTGMVIKHNLGKTPEMIWAKKRATSNWSGNSAGGEYPLDRWFVWHKDGHAENAIGYLNRNTGSGLSMVYSGSVNSVSAQFHSDVTYTNDENLMIFFASVDGISKVGSYTGNASSSGPTVTLGFAPRFILIKGAVTGTDWFVLDTTRGLTSGSDKRLSLNSSNAQETGSDLIDPSSTGFQVSTSWDQFNGNNQTFYYYAHA